MSERSGSVKRGRLFFLVGLPQSGKSFVANKWFKKPELDYDFDGGEAQDPIVTVEKPRVVLGGDDFRHAVHGREFQAESEGLVFATMDVCAKALLDRGFDVLIDETSTTEATLCRYLRIDPEATPIWIDTPVEVCKQRALASGRDYLIRPIERMAAQLAHPKANYKEIRAKLLAYLTERKISDVPI